MIKNLFLTILIILIVALGIGYAIYKDEDRLEHLLVNQAIADFTQRAPQFETEFLTNQSFKQQTFQSQVQVADINTQLSIDKIGDRVTLKFGEGDFQVANKTLVLIPQVESGIVRWQCLEGSVLLRHRPKACRLGKRLTLEEF